MAISHNQRIAFKKFTATGSFIVPAGITQVMLLLHNTTVTQPTEPFPLIVSVTPGATLSVTIATTACTLQGFPQMHVDTGTANLDICWCE
jgi:hypothetical protein